MARSKPSDVGRDPAPRLAFVGLDEGSAARALSPPAVRRGLKPRGVGHV